jgi:hypothetical protein
VFGSNHYKIMLIPPWIDIYNFHKEGVNQADQLRSGNTFDRRIKGSHHKAILLQFLFQTVLTNTYLLQRHFPGPLR